MSMQRIWGVFFRYFYVLKKGPHQLADLFYWPFVDILLWGLTSFWIQSQNTENNLPLILLTGLVFWQISRRGTIDIAFSLLQEFWHRNLVNLFSTPLKIIEWISGVLILSFFKLLITVLFGVLSVYLLYSLHIFNIGWVFLPFMVSLVLFGWTLSFISSSLIIRWGHKVEMVCWMIGFLFAPFSAVFYPVSALPFWAQKIAWSLPSTYIFEGMRAILFTKTFPAFYFWVSLALNLIYLSLSIVLFYISFAASRRKGLARLE